MKDIDWILPIFCAIWIIVFIYFLLKAKRKNQELNIKKFLMSEFLFIPGIILFIIMIVRLFSKLF